MFEAVGKDLRVFRLLTAFNNHNLQVSVFMQVETWTLTCLQVLANPKKTTSNLPKPFGTDDPVSL